MLQHLHVGRHGLFQVGQNARPTDSLAVEQRVQEDAALQHLGVLRLAEHRVELRLLFARRRDLRRCSCATSLRTSASCALSALASVISTPSESHQQQADRRRRHQHRPVAPERLAREIDRNLHFN